MPRSVTLGMMCVCELRKRRKGRKDRIGAFFKCIIHAWKDCINTFCLGRFFFLLCGCISLHASPRGSLTETKECVVSVCATDLHMHSVCQADWKWFPVVRTTAKGLYCDFRTAPVSSLSVSGPPVNSHTHPSSPPHWFFTSLPRAVSSFSTYLRDTQCGAPL